MSNLPQTAMIWGASGGIGRALAQKWQLEGWKIIALGRDESRLPDEAALKIEISSVTDEFSLQKAVMEAGIEFDQVGQLIYAVGDIASEPAADMAEIDWRTLIDANLTGAFMAVKYSLPLLAEGADVIFLGAVHERLRFPGFGAYAAAKAGLEAFAEALQKEERKRRIIVIRPGAVDTPLWEKVPMKLPKNALTPDDLAAKMYAAVVDDETAKGIIDIS